MSRNFLVALFLLGGCVASITPSSSSPPAAAQSNVASDEAAVRAAEEQERIGVLNQDFAALERIWSERFSVNTPLNTVSSDRAAVLAVFRQGFAQYSAFDRKVEYVRLEGDMAIVMGGETVVPKGNAPKAGQTVARRFTHLWQREGSTWRLIARHANDIPPA
ncbi:MAG: nuclear transport factor 2 family protein [Gemmatimonadaceae bacterium]|nr:nuclear transport factor 2 family protein [Gemmatimonadaceae bacterium]